VSELKPKREPAKDQEALFALAREILQLGEHDAILDAVVRRALTILGGDRGFLVLTQGEAPDYKIVRNWSPADYEGAGGAEPISRSILQEVLGREEPLLIEDASNDPRFAQRQSVRRFSIRSVLAAPLRLDGRVAGALYLESRSLKGFFTAGELSLFKIILELSSRALEAYMRRAIQDLRRI
jgi:GAF domain-containing protein